jgi:hypothetical protein
VRQCDHRTPSSARTEQNDSWSTEQLWPAIEIWDHALRRASQLSVWVPLYLLKSAVDFTFQSPHRRAVADAVWNG